jgi:hypothetical protein
MANTITTEQYFFLWLGDYASNQLKAVLETKHLYQKAEIRPDELIKKMVDPIKDATRKERLQKWCNETLTNERFVLAQEQLYLANRTTGENEPLLTLRVPNVSLFCKKCGRREAFAPMWSTDATNEVRKRGNVGEKWVAMPATFQLFLVVYQCQRCLGTPEGFLVRREGWNLSLHGRSPMELVEIPKYIPDGESQHYRDCVIAFNSGKVLAALFYLRTFIEQFGRRVTGMAGRATGEEIFDAYSPTLPDNLRSQMPSLREWYDKISEALHTAKEDPALFAAAKAAIEKHFEIRKVFNLSEKTPVAKEKAPVAVASENAAQPSEDSRADG